MDEFFCEEVYSDDFTQIGVSKCGHLIILQSYDLQAVHCVVLYKELIKSLMKSLKKALSKYGKSQTLFSSESYWGNELIITYNKAENKVVISQDEKSVVSFDAEKFDAFLKDLNKKPDRIN